MFNKNETLTAERLASFPNCAAFCVGTTVDSPDGVNMMNTGKPLKFVAVKGDIEDWAIYVHWDYHDDIYVKAQGDKVTDLEAVKRVLTCSDSALRLYRRR